MTKQRRTTAMATVTAALAICSMGGIAPAVAQATGGWTATWAASPQEVPADVLSHLTLDGQTVRQRMRISLGGQQVRLRLSNEFGKEPLVIGNVTLAIPVDVLSVQPQSIRAVTFSGSRSITIPPGVPILSDPVELSVAPASDVAVSIYFPQLVSSPTAHLFGNKVAAISATGDFTEQSSIPPPTINPPPLTGATSTRGTLARLFATALLVPASLPAVSVVTLGDSITDGVVSTLDADLRWPDIFAGRLAAHFGTSRATAVANAGISGNRLVVEGGTGQSALARFDRDVLSMPGVTHVIVLEGINDIGSFVADPDPQFAVALIASYRQLIARAHSRGLKIFGATVLPFSGAGNREQIRQTVNQWIRTSNEFDGVIDFDAAVRDPQQPTRMLPLFDSGDHLHPGDAGFQAMAEAIDLGLFD